MTNNQSSYFDLRIRGDLCLSVAQLGEAAPVQKQVPFNNMNGFKTNAGLILLISSLFLARTPALFVLGDDTAQPQDPPANFYSKNTPKDLVEFEMMTWP